MERGGDMTYLSKNELDKFAYTDCIADTFKISGNDILLELEALIVKSSNSQNSNYTDSYAGDAILKLSDAKLVKVLKEGYKFYDANDNLVEEVEDKEVDITTKELEELLSKTFLINACLIEEETYSLEFELPDTEPAAITDSYEVIVNAKEATVSWDKYMNRVQGN